MRLKLLVALVAGGMLPAVAAAQLAQVISHMSSGSITTPNAFQLATGKNSGRRGCTLQNTSGAAALLVFPGTVASATAAGSFSVPSGGAFYCGCAGTVLTDPIAVTSATGGATFVLNEY